MKNLITLIFILSSIITLFGQGENTLPVNKTISGSTDGVVTSGTYDGTNITLNRSVGGAVNISATILNTATNSTLTTEVAAFADCSTGAVTFTLPTASAAIGKSYDVAKRDNSLNPLILSGNFVSGSQKIIYDNEMVKLTSNGTAWYFSY